MPKRTPKRTSQQSVADREESPRQLPAVSTSGVFSFLKDTRGVLTWKMRDFQDCLNIGTKDAKQILSILQMQGYIQQQDDRKDYLTTASGEVVSGSKPPRMKRERVEEALSAIAERIAVVSRDARAKFHIRKAVAFGDFLSTRPQLQAADVGVMLIRRTPISGNQDKDEEERVFLKQLQGRNRFLHVQRYQPWMSERSHRILI
jgi:hypothetical protein